MAKAKIGSPGEPLGGVVIAGVHHQVPLSRIELEQAIADAVKLDGEVADWTALAKGKGADLEAQIGLLESQLTKLKADLALERGPTLSQVTNKQQQLEQVKTRIFNLVLPQMGDQKSMKVTGIAGSVQVERTPKMEVIKERIEALKELLGGQFTQYFEVEEKVKPLKKAWELLTSLKGRKLAKFTEAVKTSETGRVRILAGDE